MGSKRRVAAVVAAVWAATILAPEAALAAPPVGVQGAPITVTFPATPEGVPLVDPVRLNERGEVLAEVPDDPGTAGVVWRRGRVTRVTPEGVSFLAAGALSERGQVVGTRYGVAERPQGSAMWSWPFSWSAGRYVELPAGDHLAGAGDVNERGQVLGALSSPPNYGIDSVVVWDRGRIVTPPAGVEVVGVGRGINDRGQVAVDIEVAGETHAAVWQVGGGVTDLGTLGGPASWASGINEAGDVVGTSRTADGERRAFLWRDGEMVDLGTLGGSQSQGQLLNERGHVAGISFTAEGETHAFLWRDGEMVDLGTLGGSNASPLSEPVDLNNRGQVVGTSRTPAGVPHAFLWQDGRMVDLGTQAGPEHSVPVDVNDRGQVLGWRRTGDQRTAVLWTAPPRRR